LIFATVGTHHQPFDRFVRIALALAGDAQLVVQHGHTDPVAVRAGHRPIVVPRREHLGEHVDDHQLQIVTALEDIGIVTRLHNAAHATPGPVEAPVTAWPPPGLKAAVRETVLGA
jgi:UDP-N-acetylglucosamine transferase subunit ALG13